MKTSTWYDRSDRSNVVALSEAISRRIRGLLEKTIENGATEAEALAAAAKARELMDRYRLSMSDVEIQAEPIVQDEVDRPNAVRFAAVDYCRHGIERYCGVRTFLRKVWDENGKLITRRVFLGLKADVEMSRYLYEMISGAIVIELAAFQKQAGRRDRTETSSFQVGMATRINVRLIEMAKALEPTAKTGSGTALVVVKNALVDQAYDALGLKMKAYSGFSAISTSALDAGRAAGNRVNLSRPVGNKARAAIR